MRVTPDDDLYRVNTVWLGPQGLTLPWTARYLAYATWLVVFLLVLFLEAVTPLAVHLPPVLEICVTTLTTATAMSFVDHERPPRSVAQTFWAELTAPRPRRVRRTETGLRTVRARLGGIGPQVHAHCIECREHRDAFGLGLEE